MNSKTRQAAKHNAYEVFDLKESLVERGWELGLTYEEIAYRMGAPLSEVEDFGNYYSNPTLRFAQRYATAVGVRLSLAVSVEEE